MHSWYSATATQFYSLDNYYVSLFLNTSDVTEASVSPSTSSLSRLSTGQSLSNCTVPVCQGREDSGTPLQCSCLENPVDGGAWWAAVHGVAKSRTRLSGFTFTFHFHELEKEMAAHSSVLAWRIPGTGELGGLPSMGLHRVGHD